MNIKTTSNNQAIASVREHYTTGSVISQDGTRIGGSQYGRGPGLVLEQGGMGSAHNFHQLAGGGWLIPSPSTCPTAVAVASVARLARITVSRRTLKIWRLSLRKRVPISG